VTIEPTRGRARNELLSNCTECGQLALKVLESRITAHYRRRRKVCEACGAKFTTYEISREDYQLLEQAKKHGAAAPPPAPPEPPAETHRGHCSHCTHWQTRYAVCSMGFPEAGGFFASACACYVVDPQLQNTQ
jgi:hypothetical protein